MIPFAFAEKSTELYIPIDQSPGLSGKYTVTGNIDAVDYQNQTMTMSNYSGSYTVKVMDNTRIYLDKSKIQQTNAYGTFSDCKKGRKAEVKFDQNAQGRPAEWIKLEINE
jgi:hypothetical protein